MKKKKEDFIDLENQRYGLFMNENSFNLDVMYGRNFINTDNHQTVTIHRINLVESKSHSLYGQAKSKDKKYLPPVTINVMVNVDDGDQSFYGDAPGGITRNDSGNISFGVYISELNDKNLEISRGDIIEYNLSGEKNRFYEVENANSVFDTTSKTIGGFKPYWKKIIGVPVKEDVTPFLNETND